MTGYVIHYSDGVTERSKNVAASNATRSDITNLTNGSTYVITVEATSDHLSGVSDDMIITLSKTINLCMLNSLCCQRSWIFLFPFIERPPGGVRVNDIQSHSVQVSWEAVEDADSYNVRLTQTMGDNQPGLCSESHTVSVDTSSLSIVVGHTINDMLRAYTTYSITVVAMSDVWGSIGNSEPITVITNQTSDFYK